MSQIPLDSEGEPGFPGEPGEPGVGGGGAGGRGGRGGQGGRGFRPPRSRRFNLVGLALLFVTVLAVSLLILMIQDQQRHDQINKVEYIDCKKTEQVAANQRRVILALLDLEESERDHKDGEHMASLNYALTRVPKFDCRR